MTSGADVARERNEIGRLAASIDDTLNLCYAMFVTSDYDDNSGDREAVRRVLRADRMRFLRSDEGMRLGPTSSLHVLGCAKCDIVLPDLGDCDGGLDRLALRLRSVKKDVERLKYEVDGLHEHIREYWEGDE